MRRAETLVSLALAIAAGAMVREALKLRIGWTEIGPGAGFFPFWLSVGLALSALVLVVRSLRAATGAGAVGETFIPRSAFKPLLVVFLPMVAIVAFLDYFGLYLGGALYLAGYMLLVGRFRWPVTLAVSVLVPLVLFLIFEQWFRLLLPKGVILEYFLYRR
ncbi:MAG: tripartite tricarboxylate transporter TctB family protein [Armatimonadetes bacterium]|nr:tripartite tricarboxylate transporter TctB family protein [Armatimonadota bacterium]